MRIGILGTPAKPISVHSSGGTEVFCALLSQQLSKLGHEVFLFATPQADTPGVTVVPAVINTMSQISKKFQEKNNRQLTPDEKKIIDQALTARILFKAKEYEAKLDIIHDNTSSYLTGAISDMFNIPIVTSLHMPPSTFPEYVTLPPYITKVKNHYIAVSQWEKNHTTVASTVIYNGIDINSYIYNQTGGTNLIWFGRISAATPKGLPEALDVSNKTHKTLLFSGYVSDKKYYDAEIKTRIGNNKSLEIMKTSEEKNKFLSSGRAALFPIQWEEPFGLVFIEAMACGTPVIALAKGAIPEIIQDGKTGFIVNSSDDDIRGKWIIKKTGIDGLCEAVERIYAMPKEEYVQMRKNCRAHVEKNFTVERMVDGYEKVYRNILKR